MTYPVYDGIPGKTLSGIHELGGVEGVEGFRSLFADGWCPPIKFVGVDANYAVACASVFHPDAVLVFRYYAYRGCNSDDMPGWMGSDPPKQSAIRWVQHLSPEFDVLYNSGRIWYVEAFNEQGINQRQAEFYLEAATELQKRYGDRIRIAAISMSAGTYNEDHTLRTIAEHFLVPAEQRGLKYALSLHAYANWLSITDVPGLPLSLGMDINWDAIPDYDINKPRDPRHWTLFAPGDALKFWWQEYGIKPPTIISEIHIDRMPPPVEGHINGGMWEGYENGAYDRQTAKGIPIDELFARDMWFVERVLRAIKRGGGNILSAHWFTHFDANVFSRWARHYFHRGSTTNYFKYLARNAQPAPPNVPDFSNVTYCALATAQLIGVNYRSKPDARDPSVILGQLSPYEIYKIDSYTRDIDGDIWYRTAIALNTFAWVASWVVRTSDHCHDFPEWKEENPVPEIKQNHLGVWWFSDNSAFGDVQDDIMRYKPLTIRSAHAAHKTAQLLNTFLGYAPRYVIHRFWIELFLQEVGVVKIDRFDGLYNYVAKRTGANAEWKKIEDGIVDNFLEHTDHESLRDLDVYAEGFNPDTADVAYVKAEALRAMALWAGITITKGTPQGNVPKSLGNYKIKACLLNILSTGFTESTVQMMQANGLFTAARAYNSIIGVRVQNIPDSGSIDELLRVRALIPQDIEVVFVDIGTPNRANLAAIMAKVNTRLAAANLTGALFALGVNNQYEIRGLLDTIAAGDDEPPETDPGTPPVEPGGCAIPGLSRVLKVFGVGR